MAQELWAAVDEYFGSRLIERDEALAAALAESAAAGLPPIQVAPNQGKLLMLLAMLAGARRVLEIGTLGGYSTIWLARALPPDGRIVTLEVNPAHAEVARRNLERAGVADRVELRLGDARATLPALEEAGERFDLVFLDADKPSYPAYWDWAVRLTRPGGAIFADNVVRQGGVADPQSTDPNVRGVQAFTELIGKDPRVTATALQTVGSKSYDGFILAVVRP